MQSNVTSSGKAEDVGTLIAVGHRSTLGVIKDIALAVATKFLSFWKMATRVASSSDSDGKGVEVG